MKPSQFCIRLMFSLVVVLAVAVTTLAQTPKTGRGVAPTRPAAVSTSVASKSILSKDTAKAISQLTNTVDSARILGDTSKDGRVRPIRVDFNTRIVLYVSGPSKRFENSDSVALYLNGIKMPYPVTYNCPCVDSANKKKNFTLTFTLGKHDTSWNKWYTFKDSYLGVKADVGTKKLPLTCSTKNNLYIKMFSPGSLVFAWIVVAILIIVTILMAFIYNSELIKDHSSLQANKPYSLSRFQLLWWTTIIISCFILLFAIRDDFNLLSNTTLVLLGISAAGTGFAAVVDYSDSDKDRHQDVPSKGFLVDILSDADGISVHRYQNLIFTLVFGGIFVYKVLNTGNMPEFGNLELVLMGLSTATYVGLKAGENKTTPAAAAPVPGSTENIVG